MVNYLNRKSNVTEIKDIEWNSWKDQIASEGIVEKVQKNYESLISENYDIARCADQVTNQHSEDLDNINRELAFHQYF